MTKKTYDNIPRKSLDPDAETLIASGVFESTPSKFRRPYQPHGCTGHVCHPESLTEQSHVTECDINAIVKRYAGNSSLFQTPDPSLYVDLPDDLSYQSALQCVIEADAKFSAMPADLRDRFDNNPTKFLSFMSDNKNYDAAAELGLVPKRPADPPPEPSPQPPTPPHPGSGAAPPSGRAGEAPPAPAAPPPAPSNPPPPNNQHF